MKNRMMITKRSVSPALALLLVLATAWSAASGQAPQNRVIQITRIEVKGLARYAEPQVIAATGLHVGDRVTVGALDSAIDHLIGTGLFKKANYRYRTVSDRAVVTFEVEEVKWGVPVIFDNFVWFTEQELVKAVAAAVPSFDGTAPESGPLLETIRTTLSRLLQDRHLPGEVEYLKSAGIAGKNVEHVFTVKGVSIPICSLHFAGAAAIPESDLIKESKDLFKDDYSRALVSGFANGTLKRAYARLGRLRASFQGPQVKLDTSPSCQNGVSLTFQVDEGAVYRWEKAVWTGNRVFTEDELDSTLGLKTGDIANGAKIGDVMSSVRAAYGSKGYIASGIEATPDFDESSHRVTYSFTVREGPQYRMGILFINGLPKGDTAALASRWKMQPGDPYDDTFFSTFQSRIVPGTLGPGSKITESAINPDPQKHTVDIVITVKKSG
jgi:outer membrane protein assembly factor BamA